MQIMRANLMAMLFGCLGLVTGFALCRAFFVSPANQGQATNVVPAQDSCAPAREQRPVCMIVNPTFPPQVMGVWDPLKFAAEEIAQLKNQSPSE